MPGKVQIKRLAIRRMPGLSKGLDPFESLAGNINVIAGPNGTGKSSTARAIQKLFWRDEKADLKLDASVEIEGQTHTVAINSPDYYRIDGQGNRSSEDFSTLAGHHFPDRYMLALHNLVNDQDTNLAQEIVKEVFGGLDLNKASTTLGYSSAIRKTNIKEAGDYKNSDDRYKELQREQISLAQDAFRLEALEKDKEKAQLSAVEKELYTYLCEYLRLRDAQEEAAMLLDPFSPTFAALKGDDYEKVRINERKYADHTNEIIKLEGECTSFQNRLRALSIPVDGVDDRQLEEIENKSIELKEIKDRLEHGTNDITELRNRQQAAGRHVSSADHSYSDVVIDVDTLVLVEAFTRRANTVLEQQEALSAEVETLEKECAAFKEANDLNGVLLDGDKLTVGIEELSRWLKEESAGDTFSLSLLFACVGSLLAAMIVAWFLAPMGFAAFLVPAAVITYTYLSVKKQRTIVRNHFREQYKNLELDEPTVWNSTEVAARLQALINSQQNNMHLRKMEERLMQANHRLEQAVGELDKVTGEYEEIKAQIGVIPPSLSDTSNKYNSLYFFVNSLLHLQEANTKLKVAEALVELDKERYTHLLSVCNENLAVLGQAQVADVNSLKASINEIRRQEVARVSSLNEISLRKARIEQCECSRQEAKDELEVIYRRLGLTEERKDEIEVLVNRLPDYERALKRYEEGLILLNGAHKKLKSHYLYTEEIEQLTLVQAELHLSELEVQVGKFGELVTTIARIETSIDKSRRSSDMEEALAKREEALRKLEDSFHENLRSITGSVLVDQLRQEVELNNENRVFREADRILGDITHERYRLVLNNQSKPSFSAIDTKTGIRLDLDQLSTGTRVQLLISVRLAYIHVIEKQERFPILADELLANSDDLRSQAIIQALMEISKERQVFYFTAQADEVSKWETHLKQAAQLEYRLTVLGDSSAWNEANNVSMPPVSLVKKIAAPQAGIDYEAFGRSLRITPFDPLEQELSSLHLWYLFTDVNVLYRCLSRGLTYWGQLQNFLAKGGQIEGVDERTKEKIEDKVRLLQLYSVLYRVGRPRPIDEYTLHQSRAFSTEMLSAAATLLAEYNGNPLLFLEQVKSRISGFGEKKKEKLYDYLVGEGIIDGKEPIEEEELRISLLAALSTMTLDEVEANGFLSSLRVTF